MMILIPMTLDSAEMIPWDNITPLLVPEIDIAPLVRETIDIIEKDLVREMIVTRRGIVGLLGANDIIVNTQEIGRIRIITVMMMTMMKIEGIPVGVDDSIMRKVKVLPTTTTVMMKTSIAANAVEYETRNDGPAKQGDDQRKKRPKGNWGPVEEEWNPIWQSKNGETTITIQN